MEQQRMVWTGHGQIIYTLLRKRVKNLNLRLRDDGTVLLSVPLRCSLTQADEFIAAKSDWIASHMQRLQEKAELLPELERKACCELLEQSLEDMYLLVEPLGVPRPKLKVRAMRSQWGNCHWAQGYITLNAALHRCPKNLRDYVALHELLHFLHHDHGSGFYASMDALMPDWRQRRKELKRYAHAIGK